MVSKIDYNIFLNLKEKFRKDFGTCYVMWKEKEQLPFKDMLKILEKGRSIHAWQYYYVFDIL